jgi:G3E family GTPase
MHSAEEGFNHVMVLTSACCLLPAACCLPCAASCVQLRAADVVVINKCDLASLSTLSSVEDLIQDPCRAPGIRMLRARFGQVRRVQERPAAVASASVAVHVPHNSV